MASFRLFIRRKKIFSFAEFREIQQGPLNTSKVAFLGLIALLIATTFFMLRALSDNVSAVVPATGGTYYEAVIGAPQYINPLLAKTDTDKMLVALTFSGLLGYTEDGTLRTVLAQQYVLSPDHRELRVTIQNNTRFSNGDPLTSADVLFTYQMYQAQAATDPSLVAMKQVTVETPDDHTVVFKTSDTATDLVSIATKPVVSKIMWGQIPLESWKESSQNLTPVGTGPFKVKRIVYERTLPTQIVLKRNPYWVLQKPFITHLVIKNYANQLAIKEALLGNEIENTIALSPDYIDETVRNNFILHPIPTTQTVALYTRNDVTPDVQRLLRVLGNYIDKNALIATIENGYGTPFGDTTTTIETTRSGLNELGYTQGPDGTLYAKGVPVQIPIALKKDDKLIHTATTIAEQLKLLGISTEIKVFDQGTFIDQQQSKSFAITLQYGEGAIDGYTPLIPLYQSDLVHISSVHVQQYENQPQPKTKDGYYLSLATRSVRTDRVWKWFIK